jgi:hypothetical protein
MESWSGFAALAVICVAMLVSRLLDRCPQLEQDREYERKRRGEQ